NGGSPQSSDIYHVPGGCEPKDRACERLGDCKSRRTSGKSRQLALNGLVPCPEYARSKATPSETGQAAGGKNTSVRTSMLSRGGAPGVSGLSKEVWNDSRARPSLALSCTRMNSTSSGCMSEK